MDIDIFTKKNILLFIIIYLCLCLIFFLLNYSIIKLSLTNLVWLFFFLLIIFISINFFKSKIAIHNYSRKINNELPFFLNNLANDLERSISLKISLENRVDDSVIGKKIEYALFKVSKQGYSLSESLVSVSLDHPELNRVFYQIQDIINFGSKNKANTLRTLADSLIEKQNYELKNYSTKLNLISLVFIVVSAIVPAMFLMFLLVGSNFLEISFSSLSIVLITIILFPVIDMFLLLVMKYNLP